MKGKKGDLTNVNKTESNMQPCLYLVNKKSKVICPSENVCASENDLNKTFKLPVKLIQHMNHQVNNLLIFYSSPDFWTIIFSNLRDIKVLIIKFKWDLNVLH